MMTDSNDVEMMERLARGDMQALVPLTNRYQERVLAVAYRYLGHWADAEDVAQDVFLRVVEAADRYEPSAKLMTWLYRITANLCLDMRRKQARRPVAALCGVVEEQGGMTSATMPADTLETEETARRIADAVAQLPERQRLALILLRYEGLSYKQIAEVMETTESAADSLIGRAMVRLRDELADLLRNPE